MKHWLTLFIFCILLASCGSSKKVATKKSTHKPRVTKVDPKSKTPTDTQDTNSQPSEETQPKGVTGTTENYIANFSAVAQEEMKLYGIPASITLAQGILESSSGNGRLALEANNHFGIKCHDWTGDKIYHDDDAKQECFRKYKDAKYSYRDHSLFLKQRSRYSKLFTLKKNDYKSWAKELKAAGYATDRKYPDKLISLIERYELYKYDDNIDVEETFIPAVEGETYTVVKGDTLYSISRRYNLTVKELQELNSLSDTAISIGQVLKIK
ncbi:MAG: glucosaminidase domain-containing protein [Mangrovimonas sp.]|nr:glucosaminidase domain-containing protein [Mangrovimonas sp.]